MSDLFSMIAGTPALLALAALSVVLATGANWLSSGLLEQLRNATLGVIPIQGAILVTESVGWLHNVTDADTVGWVFGTYAGTLLGWWCVDAYESLAVRGCDYRKSRS